MFLKLQITNLGRHLIFPDNVDTRGALDAIRDLVGNCNIYIRDKRASKREINCLLLRDIAAYITWLLRVFGAIPTEEYIGFPVADSEGATNVRTANVIFLITNFSV
jgi:cysteinyl-tRNA synthetase